MKYEAHWCETSLIWETEEEKQLLSKVYLALNGEDSKNIYWEEKDKAIVLTDGDYIKE